MTQVHVAWLSLGFCFLADFSRELVVKRGRKMKYTSIAVGATLAVCASSQSLPTVDLGYEIHQAIAYEVSRVRLYWIV